MGFISLTGSTPQKGPSSHCPLSPIILAVSRYKKGSDVNIATHLLIDGFKQRFESAVLVTNDSDLVSPVQAVIRELNLPVGILNPHPKPSRELVKAATFLKQVRAGVLAASQFPQQLTDLNGVITKPANW